MKLLEGPDDTAVKASILKWETEFNAISKKKLTQEEDIQKIFNLDLQHCIPDMRYKLKSMNGWASAEVTQDGIALINMIRSISNKHDELKQRIMEILQSDKLMYLTYQTPEMLNTEY